MSGKIIQVYPTKAEGFIYHKVESTPFLRKNQ